MIDFFKKNKKYVHSVLFLSSFGKSLCANEETETKKEAECRLEFNNSCLNEGSYISGNVIVSPSISSKDICNKNLLDNCFWIKPSTEGHGKFFFDFNKDGNNNSLKIISFDAKAVFFNCHPVGVFIKNKNKWNIQDLFYLDNFNFSWAPVGKQINDNLFIKYKIDLKYGSSEYVRNDDHRILDLRNTVELKSNLGGQEFKFDPSLSIIINSENSFQVFNILKKTDCFAWTRFFNDSNTGFSISIIPDIAVRCNVDHELFNGGVKFFVNCFKKITSVPLQFGFLSDFKWKKDLSIVKNLKGNIGIGANSDMSFFINDKIDFSEKYHKKGKNFDNTLVNSFILYIPKLVNFNSSCDIDFTPFIKNVNKLWFVSEASTSVDLKFEAIFGLTIDHFTKIKKPSNLGKGIYFRFSCDGLKTKLNGDNIENEKLKFFMNNLKVDLLKFSLGCSPKSLKADFSNAENTKFEKIGFDLGITLTEAEFKWEKYGLTFKASVLGKGFGVKSGSFQWKDFLSTNVVFNLAEYLNNPNK